MIRRNLYNGSIYHIKTDKSIPLELFHPQRPSFPKLTYFLFSVFTIYLVLPLIDIPVMGLSLSAPLFFIIVLEVFLRPPEVWFRSYRSWIALAGAIWFGIFISGVANGLISGGVNIDISGVLSIIRYAYWLLVFVVTVYFVSRTQLYSHVGILLAVSIAVLGGLRILEVTIWGNIGAWTGTHFMNQNEYGFQYSCFSIYLFASFFLNKGKKKIVIFLLSISLLLAIVLNGSRGSWIGVLVSIGVFALLFSLFRRSGFIQMILAIMAVGGLAAFTILANQQLSSTFLSRYSTLERLENDKSYAIRQLMNQKGWRLFVESPIVGVGPGRFRKSSIPLDIPVILSYATQEYFDVKSPHNSYIGFLADTGLVGTVPFSFLLATLAIKGFRSSLLLAKSEGIWPLAIYASFIGMSVHMWAISSLTNTSNWFLYGLVASIIVTRKKSDNQSSSTH